MVNVQGIRIGTSPGRSVGAVVGLSMGMIALVQAQTAPCDSARTIQTLRAEAPAALKEAFQGDAKTCNGLVAVFSRLANRKVSGGRKLEPDRPLDEASAQAERRTALADPAFAGQLRSALGSESNPLRQMLIEAALLHDNGHYLARDLLVRQVAREVNP